MLSSPSVSDSLNTGKVMYIILIFTGVYLVVFRGNTAQKEAKNAT